MFLFADDTGIMNLSDTGTVDALEDDLARLVCWLNANQLSLNSEKCSWLNIGTFDTRIQDINLGYFSMARSKDVKYQGICIDEHLTFQTHVESLTKRLAKHGGIL